MKVFNYLFRRLNFACMSDEPNKYSACARTFSMREVSQPFE